MTRPEAPTSLAAQLAATIRHSGPISIAHYMSEALANQTHGYYTTRDPLGMDGDFITAPEVSQMFGELIGLWCADLWMQMEQPGAINLIELGPGRGTLMADAWRATKVQPGFHDAVSLHLVEISPTLRMRQQESLADARPASGPHWYSEFNKVPPAPLLLVANELLDALPIHQYERMVTGWHERLVDLVPGTNDFRIIVSPHPIENPQTIPDVLEGTPIGGVVERCPAAEALVAQIAEQIRRFGGAALFIDYGYTESAPHDTLQGVRRHSFHPVLDTPGSADLCAHVDFARLREVALNSRCSVWGPSGQGDWLNALGLRERARRLKDGTSAVQQSEIDTALERLVDPAKMGFLFKVMAVASADLAPAGFGATV